MGPQVAPPLLEAWMTAFRSPWEKAQLPPFPHRVLTSAKDGP